MTTARQRSGPAFTLIELILVMALLSIVLAVSAPALSRFFRGRSLDSEARRFLSLTRYAQSQAVSEGVPMILWMDPEQRRYGLEPEATYTDQTPKRFEFALDPGVSIEVDGTGGDVLPRRQETGFEWSRTTMAIRFTPEAFLSETSPDWVLFKQGEQDEVWLGRSRNGLNYEIQTNQFRIENQ